MLLKRFIGVAVPLPQTESWKSSGGILKRSEENSQTQQSDHLGCYCCSSTILYKVSPSPSFLYYLLIIASSAGQWPRSSHDSPRTGLGGHKSSTGFFLVDNSTMKFFLSSFLDSFKISTRNCFRAQCDPTIIKHHWVDWPILENSQDPHVIGSYMGLSNRKGSSFMHWKKHHFYQTIFFSVAIWTNLSSVIVKPMGFP